MHGWFACCLARGRAIDGLRGACPDNAIEHHSINQRLLRVCEDTKHHDIVGHCAQEFLEAFLASEATEEDRGTPALAGSLAAADAAPEAGCNDVTLQAAAVATPVVAGSTQRTDVRTVTPGPEHAGSRDAGRHSPGGLAPDTASKHSQHTQPAGKAGTDAGCPTAGGLDPHGGGPAADVCVDVAAEVGACSQGDRKESSTEGAEAADQALFLSWQMLDQQARGSELAACERDLADALTLLPDLEQLARSMVTQHGGLTASDALPFQLDLAAMMF
eukprot:1143302-Pelagomonas_calceolata.AAC.9